ncbi:SMI1/KNR4 family protein [Paenibacillus durus]|uniref:Knr4/Smi1-like domain-containing protein n=1 Tax=Paenibacillus durus TaxID=44251 RepID=A0A089HTU7_PAEDU|nr:SMI1/KNR4 family protein [Paenibacillus durus]AIQ13788.1 hypothetical protein PDUR_19100 [Paenibacillus durus]
MFKKRNYEEIANGLQKREKPVSVNEQFPEDYLWVCKNFSENKISADYVLLSYEKAKQYNKDYHKDFAEFDENMWIFAETGQGDFWLINLSNTFDSTVYFYDHDAEDFQSTNILNMSVDLKEWFILADLVSQMEELLDTQADIYFDENLNLKNEYRQELLGEVEKIKEGLSDIYPFEL